MAKKENIKMDTQTPQELNREMKTIRNWEWFDKNTSASKERDILTPGKMIDTGKSTGIITKIEGNTVFVENSEGKVVNMTIKDVLKSYKTPKDKKEIVANIAIEGPSNATSGKAPAVGKSFAPSLDAKSTKAKDQKIATKNNPIANVKSFSDLAKDFDSTAIKSTKSSVATEVTGKASKSDDKLMKANTTITYVKSFSDHSDLVSNPTTGKSVKSKNNDISSNIDSKVPKAEDNKISKKINKVKSFTELNSKVETGPNK